MNALGFSAVLVQALGWSLVQFVWQAAAVGLVYAALRMVLPRGNARYIAAMLALVALAAMPVVTVWHGLAQALAAPLELGPMVVVGGSAATASAPAMGTWHALLAAALPWIVLGWLLGVGVLGVRVWRQWHRLRAMLKAAQALPAWQARAREFAERLGLRRVVPVLASVRVATPTLVGWIRPAVVLPLAVLAQMPAAQIDLILAHELAHLRRCDHLANLFQVVLETLFFYHPVVHWISRDARNERELCCDALALRATGGTRRDFVAALAGLEDLRAGDVDLALAATGGVLVERAWFIAGTPPRGARWHLRGQQVAVVAVMALCGIGWAWWQHAATQRATAALAAGNRAVALRWAQPEFATPQPTWSPVLAFDAPRLHTVASAPATPSVPAKAPIIGAAPAPVRLTIAAPVLRLMPLAPVATAAIAAPPSAAPAAVSSAPQPLHTMRPVYPPAALLAGAEARVAVDFTLDARGVPQRLRVVGAGAGALAAAFGNAALQAMQRWRFAPPAVSGRRYRQVFTFQLAAAPAADAAASARACMVETGTHICR
ncbi:MAG TPA: M56 family metallopeptidase, partial [Rhodanobacteraceae bacterium]